MKLLPSHLQRIEKRSHCSPGGHFEKLRVKGMVGKIKAMIYDWCSPVKQSKTEKWHLRHKNAYKVRLIFATLKTKIICFDENQELL